MGSNEYMPFYHHESKSGKRVEKESKRDLYSRLERMLKSLMLSQFIYIYGCGGEVFSD